MADSAISELRARMGGSIRRLAGEVLGDERPKRAGRLRVGQGHATSSARKHDTEARRAARDQAADARAERQRRPDARIAETQEHTAGRERRREARHEGQLLERAAAAQAAADRLDPKEAKR